MRATPVRGGRAVAAGVAIVALASGACDATPAPSAAPGGRAMANGFVLETSLPKDVWAPDEAIDVRTTLTYVGPEDAAGVWGSGSGLVSFVLAEVGGTKSVGGAARSDCRPYRFARGVATDIPFAKSGGWSADDPNAAFYQAFFADRLLHLPPGRWSLQVSADGMLAPCAADAPRLAATIPAIVLTIR